MREILSETDESKFEKSLVQRVLNARWGQAKTRQENTVTTLTGLESTVVPPHESVSVDINIRLNRAEKLWNFEVCVYHRRFG